MDTSARTAGDSLEVQPGSLEHGRNPNGVRETTRAAKAPLPQTFVFFYLYSIAAAQALNVARMFIGSSVIDAYFASFQSEILLILSVGLLCALMRRRSLDRASMRSTT